MGTITSMAFQAAIILALEYIIYKWVLSSSTFFRINRAIIMSCYFLAVILSPVMSLWSKWFYSLNHYGVVVFGPIELKAMSEAADGASSFSFWQWIPIIYITGVVVTAILLSVSYIRLMKVIRKGQKIEKDGYVIVISDSEIAPYSWGKYIVVAPEDADNHLIALHERAHIRFYHSWELVIANLFVVFNWFNPASYLMRRELSAVQEYEADEQVLRSNVSAKEYQMLLIRKTVGSRFHAISNSLNHSQLKNRLTMMIKSKSKRTRLLAASLLLPALIGAVAITSTPAIASVLNTVESISYNKVINSDANDQQTPLKIINVESITGSLASDPSLQVFDQPEELPKFKGGETDLYRTLAFNMKYPTDAADAGQQGKVLVKFIVSADGKASEFEIAESSGYESLDNEALRVCRENISTGWTPGKNNGKPIACSYSLPVMFRLQ